MRILLVEDDRAFAEVVKQALIGQQYLVDIAVDGAGGWELAHAFTYDAIVLDLMLPRLDGIRFCQQLRIDSSHLRSSPNRHTPILMITAQAASTDKVSALDSGADDYLVKPFDLTELLARVRALLRRRDNYRSPILVWEDVQLNPSTGEVSVAGKSIHLSAKEYNLLELLMRSPKRIFSYSSLIEHLWALEHIPSENAVRAQIKGLRRKLKAAGATDAIETIYGLGYRLRQSVVKPRDTLLENHPSPVLAIGLQSQDEFPITSGLNQSKIDSLFKQHRAGYCHRLALIEQVVATWRSGNLTEECQQRARQEAHTLKGSLGLFEMEEASQLSCQIEQLLQQTLHSEVVEQLETLVTDLKQFLVSPDNSSAIEATALTSNPDRSLTLWIVGEEKRLITPLIEAAACSFQIEIVATADQVEARLMQACPDAMLLTFAIANSARTFRLLHRLTMFHPTLPVFVLATEGTSSDVEPLQQRLKVAQLGAKGFWQLPIAPTQIIKAIVQALQLSGEKTAKLLIVDDDCMMLQWVREILQPWGFELTLLNDPQKFWTTLEKIKPDLAILDIEMPHVSGIELCQVVRNDLQWNELPILFLSAHTDDATLQKIFTVGGDDYISKPVRTVELVVRVLRRLEQAQLRKQIRTLKVS